MNDRLREAVHSEPAWRDRSDFIIASRIDPGTSDVMTEQLWARRLNDRQFEICCIPFFVYDLALGDVVETDEDYMVQRVIKPSGRFTFRVSFGQSFYPRDAIATGLQELGGLLEWSSQNMVAVDASDAEHGQMVADFLWEHEQLGELIYETGRTGGR